MREASLRHRLTLYAAVALAVCLVVVLVHAHADAQRPDCGVCHTHAMPGMRQESDSCIPLPASLALLRAWFVPNLKLSNDVQIHSGRAPPATRIAA